jgi:hypothetical protein
MLALFLISGSVITIALYRSIAPLLRQIPNRNLDFNPFLLDAPTDQLSPAGMPVISDQLHSNANRIQQLN